MTICLNLHQQPGVPQGSIFSLYLFLIFIIGLPFLLKQSAAADLYADDTIFYDFQNDIGQLETYLHLTFNSLQDCCRQNGMVIITKNKTKQQTNKSNVDNQ